MQVLQTGERSIKMVLLVQTPARYGSYVFIHNLLKEN